jgi:hypothetical protein
MRYLMLILTSTSFLTWFIYSKYSNEKNITPCFVIVFALIALACILSEGGIGRSKS